MSQTDLSAPTLFLLHFLGGSARAWTEVAQRLAPRRCVALDLPGFGDAAGLGGRTVAEMADHVAAAVRAEAPRRWALVGHSMGGKVAAVLARRAEDGEAGLEGLAAVVLLAASPAGPEPIEAGKRAQMLDWFRGDADRSLAEASGYVAQNVGAALPDAVEARTVEDVMRADPAAWRAWLEHGSREDWAARVGLLRTPALVVAGAEDDALGADAQRGLVTRAFARWRAATLAGAGHLLPVERPAEVAGLIAAFLDAPEAAPAVAGADAGETHRDTVAGLSAHPDGTGGGAAWRALLGSDRVSARTRTVLLARARPDRAAAAGRVLSEPGMATLRLMLDRVVPQPGGTRIDLAARVDAVLAAGVGDGWRMAQLPPDAEACAAGLATLDAAAGAAGFAGLGDAAQDALLARAAGGTLDAGAVARATDGTAGGPRLDAARMRLWFDDVRSMAVRAYVSHPATLARMGYSGIGYGGDGPRLEGFVRLGIGAREDWEPVAQEPAPPAGAPQAGASQAGASQAGASQAGGAAAARGARS